MIFLQPNEEKQDLYKAEIIREIMDGKSVLSVDRYALYPDNWWTMTEEATLDIDRHVRTPEGESSLLLWNRKKICSLSDRQPECRPMSGQAEIFRLAPHTRG